MEETMEEPMLAAIIKIGNSKGLRIPKAILEQCKMDAMVDLTVENGKLIVTPYKNPREGWAEAARLLAATGDDALLDAEYIGGPLENDEWEWE
jgi:antitoxin MazE